MKETSEIYSLQIGINDSINTFIAYTGYQPGSFVDYIKIETIRGLFLEIGNDRNKIKGRNLSVEIKKNETPVSLFGGVIYKKGNNFE